MQLVSNVSHTSLWRNRGGGARWAGVQGAPLTQEGSSVRLTSGKHPRCRNQIQVTGHGGSDS